MNQQTTSYILMIRPVNFGFNEQTAGSNAFQNRNSEQQQVQDNALREFDDLVNLLQENGIKVCIVNDTPEPHTPDSIFPNNWVSFHSDGSVFLYPMMAENRRLERREDIIMDLEDAFDIKRVIDLSRFEHENKFLEGTGSMVLDRENKIAYACVSPRTNKEVLDLFCTQSGYKPVLFHAVDENSMAIYHTNVLMCVGTNFVVICLDSITDENEKSSLMNTFKLTHKAIISITFKQMAQFAGNMLELKNQTGDRLLVMSQSAFLALKEDQKTALGKYCRLLYANIDTIERNGGGSARCMIAELHLPPVN